ncbi:MAG TPA: hypothetical protein DDZ80_09235 [Cyanobacteria bacterium UBA8803]|nr:hypothetical protein [Cyanobacteria bacterium UBA9273]HBL58680.1 hypothetical protein [Cyanobacteria bacterium UBA8803]
MDLEMVLNELSLRTPAADIPTARQLMSELIRTVRQATVSGVKRVLRTSDDINTIELAPDYPVARWRNDNGVNREERSFFRTLTTKAPFWTDIAEAIKNNFDLSDVIHQGEEARGLCFALVSDALPVSLNSEARWNHSRLELTVTRLEDEELIEEHLEIIHASCRHHIQEHTDWIQKRIRIEVIDGLDLWKRREELFTSLEFCDNVGKQIQSLNIGNPMLRQVVKRLYELDDYCKIWASGSFNPDNLPSKATPESDTRLQQFQQELIIRCPDGEKRIFSLHVRMTPGAWRLHFCVESGPGKIIIGYIGPKIQ